MKLSNLCKGLIRGADGKVTWKEVSELKFPKEGYILSFKQTSLAIFVGFMGLFIYAQLQEEINPNSKWGVIYRRITRDPLYWLGADKTEEKPAPSLSSHLK